MDLSLVSAKLQADPSAAVVDLAAARCAIPVSFTTVGYRVLKIGKTCLEMELSLPCLITRGYCNVPKKMCHDQDLVFYP